MEARTPSAKRETPWTLIVFGVIGVYAVIVALLNSERVKVDFLFFSASTRLLVLILLCLALGFVGGVVFDHWRLRRKREQA